jgi:DNA-binding response OmpR family regulator
LQVNVLVFESEEATADSIRRAGHGVTVTRDARDVCALTASGSVDAVVLGRSDPEDESLTVCEVLRRDGVALPIVLIVAGNGVEARIEALDAGADDCVETGCHGDELLARLRALVRRKSLKA